MKWKIAFAGLAVPSLASACPPTNQHPSAVADRLAAEQLQVAKFKAHAQVSAIVYGVLEKGLGFDGNGKFSPGSLGELRIIHVYKGAYREGQRVVVRQGAWPLTRCPPLPVFLQKGAYGIAVLDEPTDGSPVRHNGFLPQSLVDMFLKDGIIQSAGSSPR